jgi:hypothetical protein
VAWWVELGAEEGQLLAIWLGLLISVGMLPVVKAEVQARWLVSVQVLVWQAPPYSPTLSRPGFPSAREL